MSIETTTQAVDGLSDGAAPNKLYDKRENGKKFIAVALLHLGNGAIL